MSINWYPGHMAKTRRAIEEVLPSVDVVAELVDARIPFSSRNPDLAKLTAEKPKIIILNKSDLADPVQNKKWLDYYREQGCDSLLFDSKSGKKTSSSVQEITSHIQAVNKKKAERSAARGIVSRSVRLMILGVPNVGKSTFINCICGSAKTRAEDRPGVTRSLQWVNIGGGIDMLDVPGMLWPKLEDQTAAQRLAMTGAINDLVLDTEELSLKLLKILMKNYSSALISRYRLTLPFPEEIRDLLCLIARKRGFMIRGGEVDTERASAMLLDEFRGGKLGRITLDVL